MKVGIKSFDVKMDVKNKGIELEVHNPSNGNEHLGDCYVTKGGLIWCEGKKERKNGIKLGWKQLMEICKSEEAKKAAIKAANKS